MHCVYGQRKFYLVPDLFVYKYDVTRVHTASLLVYVHSHALQPSRLSS